MVYALFLFLWSKTQNLIEKTVVAQRLKVRELGS